MQKDDPSAAPIDLMKEIVSLAKQRGFVFQSSEIYGGLGSAWDYGPLGVELKENVRRQWWRAMVTRREDVVGQEGAAEDEVQQPGEGAAAIVAEDRRGRQGCEGHGDQGGDQVDRHEAAPEGKPETQAPAPAAQEAVATPAPVVAAPKLGQALSPEQTKELTSKLDGMLEKAKSALGVIQTKTLNADHKETVNRIRSTQCRMPL